MRFGSWVDLKRLALPIRLTVFVEEQGVPYELEQDEFDEQATHVVAFDVDGCAVATGRVLTSPNSTAKIGRIAVLEPYRGKGYGKAVLRSLIEQADVLGAKTLKLHAQCEAEHFYRSFGFQALGEPFMEAGIRHVLMVRQN
ncbi:GNAT family N-acetyltransferase [Orrella daihaiensis]|uniref:GNAT family N-acetyltransferase n=1 Tax=Orrella daihaiensis TaxID=2782176 RepID=A0ABY4AMR0_9BURK|nr:GNAT family N-acetyltransferase [Orrella daihaiensis]